MTLALSSGNDSGSLLWRYQPISHLKAASRKEKMLVIGHGRLSVPEGTERSLHKLLPLGGDVCCLPEAQVKDVKIMKINLPIPDAALRLLFIADVPAGQQ